MPKQPEPVFPDTAQGALRALRWLAVPELDMTEAKCTPDPQHRGIWKVEGLRLDGRTGSAIVYLSGYEERWLNDFETDLDED